MQQSLFTQELVDGRAERGRAATIVWKSGGLVLIHGFAKRQPRYDSGGPRAPDHLYDLDLLRAAFPRWEILHQADYDSVLQEGVGHSGLAALVDFVARKPVRTSSSSPGSGPRSHAT